MNKDYFDKLQLMAEVWNGIIPKNTFLYQLRAEFAISLHEDSIYYIVYNIHWLYKSSGEESTKIWITEKLE